jgi:hypothetical protein
MIGTGDKSDLGRFRAIRDAGYSIVSSIEIRTTQDNKHVAVQKKPQRLANGYFIAVLVL